MKKGLLFLILCVWACGWKAPARAAEFSASDGPAYSGYLVKLSDEAAGAEESAAQMVAPGVYRVDREGDLAPLLDCGVVETMEPDYIVTLEEDGTSSETGESGWAYGASAAGYAAALGLRGGGVRIAVIDSGVDLTDVDLEDARIEAGRDYTGDTNTMTDPNGHGTRVIRMIAADDDGTGVTGIAREVTVVPLRCFDAAGSTKDSYLISAIYDAVDTYHCNIINMSWGTPTDSTFLQDAIRHAYDAGVILVAAAGNVGAYAAGTVLYPAAYDEVIGVGAVDTQKTVLTTSQQTAAVFVCAPGGAVIDGKSGTSFAAPCVAAAAALTVQLDGDFPPAAFSQLLTERAVDLGAEGYDSSYGWGFVSLDALLGRTWCTAVKIGTTLNLDGWLCSADGGIVLAAAYGSGGQMLSSGVRSIEKTIGGFHFSFDSAPVSVGTFYVNKTYAPLDVPYFRG